MNRRIALPVIAIVLIVLLTACTFFVSPTPVDGLCGEWKTYLYSLGINADTTDYYTHLILRKDGTGTALTTADGYRPEFNYTYDEEKIVFSYVNIRNGEKEIEMYPYRMEEDTLIIIAEKEYKFEYVTATPTE